MDKEKLKVAIVGAGNIARTVHIPAYNKAGLRVAALTDINLEGAEKLAQEAGIAYYNTDFTEMLQVVKPDIVSVCVPNKFHYPMVMEALAAGCHVFCEKPPALDYEQAAEMAALAEKSNLVLAYNFCHRFRSEAEVMRQMVAEQELGTVYHGKIEAIRRRAIPGWGVFTNKDLQGGGALIDLGIHMLDLALWTMNFPTPAYVAASMSDRIGRKGGQGVFGSWEGEKFSVEDGLFGHIQFTDGSSLSLTTTFALHLGQKETTRMNLELYGDKAGIGLAPFQLFTSEDGTSLDKGIHVPAKDFSLAGVLDFIGAVLDGHKPIAGSESVLLTQKIIDALYKSASTNSPVVFT